MTSTPGPSNSDLKSRENNEGSDWSKGKNISQDSDKTIVTRTASGSDGNSRGELTAAGNTAYNAGDAVTINTSNAELIGRNGSNGSQIVATLIPFLRPMPQL